MSFIAGQFTLTNKPPGGAATSIGQIKDGAKIEYQVFKRLITGDNMAESPQDAVYRGMAAFIEYTLLEYNAAGALGVFFPYGTAWLLPGIIGRLDVAASQATGMCGEIVLTAVAGTPAAAAPATITLGRTILAEGYPVSLLMAPDLREIPLRQRIYPTQSTPGGVMTFGVLT